MFEETIKNIHTKVKKDPVMLIKGKVGFQTIIKKIICNNKTIKSNTINIYILNKKEKHYLERNVLVVPNSRLELLKNKSLVINKNDRIFIECIKETEIDIICEYIEKLININDICLILTDQYGENVENITHNIENSPFELNRKIIRINNNADIVENLEVIEFEINNNQIKFFKNNNNFEIISEYPINELDYYFEINLFQKSYTSINDISCSSFLKVKIAQENEKWRYINLFETPVVISEWYDSDTTVVLIPGEYEIEFEEFGEVRYPNYQIQTSRNNFYDLNFDLENDLTNQTHVSILKSDFIPDDDFSGVRWRILGLSNTLNYNEFLEGEITPGTYQIEVQGISEYFETIIDQINIYEHQKTIYKINDELIRINNPPTNYIYPERLNININVTRKPILSVTIEPSGINAHWRLIDLNGVKTDWNESDNEIKINPEIYSIEFEDICGYTKPNTYKLPVINSKKEKIKALYLKNLQHLLTIDIVIPNKYRDYLNWCLVKPNDFNEYFIINWNDDIHYSDYLYQGHYQLKIREVIFQEFPEDIVYSFEDGISINNKKIIEGQIIDIYLNQDITITKTLIVEMGE